ncbi:MAG: phosphopantothenoylcysteine decarboxylase [Candidatus Thorarchaeota archaeon]
MTPKDMIQLQYTENTLPLVLQQTLQTCTANVGIVLLNRRLSPSIYRVLWDFSSVSTAPTPLLDNTSLLSDMSWKSLFGAEFVVSRSIDPFLERCLETAALIVLSDGSGSPQGSIGKHNGNLKVSIVFPPFPSDIKDPTEFIHSNRITTASSEGNMPELSFFALAQIARHQSKSILRGKRVLVAAGPTQGPMDAVRYISSTSSGGLGSEIADMLYLSGAEVIALLGKGSTKMPQFGSFSWIRTPEDLRKRVEEDIPNVDAAVFAAAVLDYVPKAPKGSKTPSGLAEWTIELQPTPKIINLVKQLNPSCILVAFKLLVDVSEKALLAEAKNRVKEADILVANDLRKVREDAHEAFVITKNSIHKGQSKNAIAQLVIAELEGVLSQ